MKGHMILPHLLLTVYSKDIKTERTIFLSKLIPIKKIH